jgi:hypothetical protein
MNINKVFYFFIFLNYISGQVFGERAVSFSKKCLTAKSTYILPLFFASNFYFFTQKKRIVTNMNIAIENYKKKLFKLNELDETLETNEKFFKKYEEEFDNLKKMFGSSLLSYIFSTRHFLKSSCFDLGKEFARLDFSNKKIKIFYRSYSFYYDNEERILKILQRYSYYFNNELIKNFKLKFLLDFVILSFYFYKKSLTQKNLLIVGFSFHFFLNIFLKKAQRNRIIFLTKLFFMNNSENIEKLKKEFQDAGDTIDFLVDSENKKLRENIFYQNLFVVPIVNQVALAHYSFKNYPSHLICFPGFLAFSLINHIILSYFSSLILKNTRQKSLSHLALLFFDFFIFYHYFMQYQKLKKKEEEKNRLKP